MMQSKQKALLIAVLVWMMIPAGELLAQAGGFTGSFSRIGFAPRGMAMGNAFTAVPHDGIYSYYNPALSAAPSEQIQFDISSAALKFDRRLHMVSAHFQLPPSAGLSVALLNGRVENIDGRTQSGYSTEIFSTNEYQLLSNFGIRFSDTFWGGIGIKFNLADFHSEVNSETSVGVDAGLYKQFERLGIGLAVQDLLAKTNYDTSNLFGSNTGGSKSNDYPARIKLGGSYIYSDDLLFSLEYEVQVLNSEIRRESLVVTEGVPVTSVRREDLRTNSQIVRLGTRYHLHPRVTLRGGLQALDLNHDQTTLQPTAGFSLHLPFDRFTPSIDYAFVREPSHISTMHVFSIRLNL